MLSSAESPRPLPPAKARRSSAMQKISITPPPAYGSPFTLPTRRTPNGLNDILGSPMAATFHMVGWEEQRTASSGEGENVHEEWMNEKSREELKELLVKADGLIKERENELGITSAVCKGLYQNNVALMSKHEAFLSKFSSASPAPSNSSPDGRHSAASSRRSSVSITSSNSESALGLVRSRSPIYRRPTRKLSIASAEISMLADQNAELLDKLEKLEAEATSADHAGRRELKRLEKEITFLRDALEKTQAKSEELEEKVQDAVVGEAWRRKREREAKFKAMRNLTRSAKRESGDEVIRNFAPVGSKFGGPSDAFSFFPRDEVSNFEGGFPTASCSDGDLNMRSSYDYAEHSLISQLLVKVNELEETNAQILKQQTETANQLSSMQRDTAHIAQVYESIAEYDAQIQDGGGNSDEDEDIDPSSETVQFSSIKRGVQKVESSVGTCVVHPEIPTSAMKNRKTVLGLFDGPESDKDSNKENEGTATLLAPILSPWTEDREYLSSSSFGDQSLTASPSLSPRALSPLHFFSPASEPYSEYIESPIDSRPTLQSELNKELGDNNWDMHADNQVARSSSLYDISEGSAPPSPSPISRDNAKRSSAELHFEALKHAPRRSYVMTNSLQLSVEPPTPNQGASRRDGANSRSSRPANSIRSRSNRWVERRMTDRARSRSRDREDSQVQVVTRAEGEPQDGLWMPLNLSSAVGLMVESFGSFVVPDPSNDPNPAGGQVSRRLKSRSRSPPRAEAHDGNSIVIRNRNSQAAKEKCDESQSFWLQVWLWLQFALVLFVFLWAVAKRGPSIVLSKNTGAAQQRK